MRLTLKSITVHALLAAAFLGALVSSNSFAECVNPVRALVEAQEADPFPDSLDTTYDRVMVIGKGAKQPTITVTNATCSAPPCECGKQDVSPYNNDSNYPTADTYYGTTHPMIVNVNRGKPNRVFASVYLRESEYNPGKKWGAIEKSQALLGPCKLVDSDGNTRYFFKATFCD